MVTERPLASLPREQAEQFIRALFAPDERCARAFHHYYRDMLRQNAPTAKLNTHIELARAVAKLLANLDDPHVHVLCRDDEPVGIFGYRALREHSFGVKIANVVMTGALATRCTGPLGIAHRVGVLEAHADMDLHKRIFAAVTRKATAAGHRQLFVFTSDHRLESLYTPFGMEVPAELAVPDSKHLVGMFDLARCENRSRIAHLEHELDRTERRAA